MPRPEEDVEDASRTVKVRAPVGDPFTPHYSGSEDLWLVTELKAQLVQSNGRLEDELRQVNRKLDAILRSISRSGSQVSFDRQLDCIDEEHSCRPLQRPYVKNALGGKLSVHTPSSVRTPSIHTRCSSQSQLSTSRSQLGTSIHQASTSHFGNGSTIVRDVAEDIRIEKTSPKESLVIETEKTDFSSSLVIELEKTDASQKRGNESLRNSSEVKVSYVGSELPVPRSVSRVLRRARGQRVNRLKIISKIFGHDKKPGHHMNIGEPKLPGLSELQIESSETETDIRCRVQDFLEDPESTFAAGVYARLLSAIIMGSCALNFFQTVKPPPINPDVVVPIEILFDAIFLLEVIVRFSVSPQKLRFFMSIHNIIDCVGSGPPLLLRLVTRYLLVQSDTTDEMRYYVLCLAPVLRMLKMLRRWAKFHLLIYSGVKLIIEVMPVLLVMLFLMAITFASLIYFVEPRDNIEALPTALWMTIVTMTTVGYGDVTPKSTPGSIITSVLVICSALYMAVPLGIVGNAFSQVWEDRDWLYLVQHVQERLSRNGYAATDIPHLFKMFGTGQGEISLEDFHRMLADMRLGIREDKILDLFSCFDTDSSGSIDAAEFIRVIFPSHYTRLYGRKSLMQMRQSGGKNSMASSSEPRNSDALMRYSVAASGRNTTKSSGKSSITNLSSTAIRTHSDGKGVSWEVKVGGGSMDKEHIHHSSSSTERNEGTNVMTWNEPAVNESTQVVKH